MEIRLFLLLSGPSVMLRFTDGPECDVVSCHALARSREDISWMAK